MTAKPPPPDPNLISLSTRDRGSHHPPQPDDWQVVEEALDKLYHFTPHSPDEVDIGRSQQHDDARSSLARLREREAQLEAERDRLMSEDRGFKTTTDALIASQQAAEARVAEWEARCDRMADLEQKASARVARLEEALRKIAGKIAPIGSAGKEVREIARRALAHEEEKA